MKLELTYQEIIDLDKALQSVGAIKTNPKFSMRVAQNIHLLRDHIKFLGIAEEPSKEMIAVDKQRREIFDKYAIPENGNMKVPDEKWPEFKEEIDTFKEKNKKITDAYEKQMEEYTALLKTIPLDTKEKPKKLDMVEIPESLLPKGLSGVQIEGVFQLIKLK